MVNTPANFNGFRVLAALLHGTIVMGVSQTLRRWIEGATYRAYSAGRPSRWTLAHISSLSYGLRNPTAEPHLLQDIGACLTTIYRLTMILWCIYSNMSMTRQSSRLKESSSDWLNSGKAVKAKFYYASWFEAGSELQGSKLVRSWFEAGSSWNLAYHLAC